MPHLIFHFIHFAAFSPHLKIKEEITGPVAIVWAACMVHRLLGCTGTFIFLHIVLLYSIPYKSIENHVQGTSMETSCIKHIEEGAQNTVYLVCTPTKCTKLFLGLSTFLIKYIEKITTCEKQHSLLQIPPKGCFI